MSAKSPESLRPETWISTPTQSRAPLMVWHFSQSMSPVCFFVQPDQRMISLLDCSASMFHTPRCASAIGVIASED